MCCLWAHTYLGKAVTEEAAEMSDRGAGEREGGGGREKLGIDPGGIFLFFPRLTISNCKMGVMGLLEMTVTLVAVSSFSLLLGSALAGDSWIRGLSFITLSTGWPLSPMQPVLTMA